MRHALILALLAGPALADADDDTVLSLFRTGFAQPCDGAFLEDGGLVEPMRRFDLLGATSTGEPLPMVLWQFRCMVGAYNVTSVFYIQTPDGMAQPMSLAEPDLDIQTQDPQDPDSPVTSLTIAGWSASPFAVNATFDAETQTLTTYAAWRGVGDASSSATYSLIDVHFRLIRHDVDASYDGAVNPVTLYPAP